MEKYGQVFSSEAVTKGHPDKVCDQISDAILDEYLKEDCKSRVACETMIMPDKVLVMGEVSTQAKINVEKIVRKVLNDVGYSKDYHGISPTKCKVEINFIPQSKDIERGVLLDSDSHILGAGDQGIMHGYATEETPLLLPLPFVLARRLVQRLDWVREEKILDYLLSDGKAQVSVLYDTNMRPVRVVNVVLSTQTLPDISIQKIRKDILEKVICKVIPSSMCDESTQYYINPTGRFVSGGVQADCGLTGRKIIADTYGGWGRHGGGAFSGKDATKVDRTGAYMARYLARQIVEARLCKRVDIQLAYSIGHSEPIGIYIDTFGTGKVSDEMILDQIVKRHDLSLAAIIQRFELYRPIYYKLAQYGHFGREDLETPWEC